jgi:HK97 family phage prohead protease
MTLTHAQTTNETGTIRGTAVPYNRLSEVLQTGNGRGFREKFAPGAAKVDDLTVMYMQHDQQGIPLGRVGAGTLRFREEPDGLKFEADLPESRQDVREAVARRDLIAASVGFILDDDGDSWVHSRSGSVRTVRAARIIEVSLVSVPGYPDATVEG